MWNAKLNRIRPTSWGSAALALVLILAGGEIRRGAWRAQARRPTLASSVFREPLTRCTSPLSTQQSAEGILRGHTGTRPDDRGTGLFLTGIAPDEVELRVIRNSGNSSAEANNVDAITEIYLPPQKRPTGTFNFRHNFEEGNYVGLLKLRDEFRGTYKPVSVRCRQVSMQHSMHLGLMFLMLLVGGGAVIWVARTKRARIF